MKPKLPKTSKFVKSYCVEHGKDFRLKDIDPADTQKLDLKEEAKDFLEKGVARLSDLQQTLYAQDQWAVLVILQGMDGAGKDSVIRHVMSGVNPQGCEVYSFKQRKSWWFECIRNFFGKSRYPVQLKLRKSGRNALKTSTHSRTI